MLPPLPAVVIGRDAHLSPSISSQRQENGWVLGRIDNLDDLLIGIHKISPFVDNG